MTGPADLDAYRHRRALDTLTRLHQLAAAAATEEEAREVAAQIRAFTRRVRAQRWEPYVWQHPHEHPPGWESLLAPGVCDHRCGDLPPFELGVHEVWLQRGGRGTGKTEGAAHYWNGHVEGPPCDTRAPGGHRLTIVAPTQPDAVTSCVTGVSGLQAINPAITVTTTKEGTLVRWPNGAVGKVLGAHDAKDVERARAWTNVCVAEGTMVRTQGGLVPIEDVRPGHLIWTRTGLRRVVRAESTGVRPVVAVVASSGESVYVTPDHPMARPDGTFTDAEQGGSVLVWSEEQWSTTGSSRPSAQTGTTSGGAGSSTGTSTSARSGPSPQDTRFTTVTTTRATTQPATSWLSLLPNTPGTTWLSEVLSSTRLGAGLRRWRAPRWVRSVSSAGRTSPTGTPPMPSSAPVDAASGEPRHGHTSHACASCVEQGSLVHAGTAPVPAPRAAAVSPPMLHARVYDLAVEGHHEFYAGGILVGNCGWWLEEAAAMNHLGGMLEQAPFTLRLGDRPHMVITTTPKNRPEVAALIDGDTDLLHVARARIQTWGRTRDAYRLPTPIRDSYERMFGGTTLGRQELDGEKLTDVAGALWVMDRPDTVDGAPNKDDRPGINNHRLPAGSVGWNPHTDDPVHCIPPEAPEFMLERAVVAVDPPGGRTECGIIGLGTIGRHGYCVADLSIAASPDTWGRRAVQAYLDLGAEGIVLEKTYGEDMTEHTIATAAEGLGVTTPPIFRAPTKVGKKLRAEPVVAVSQQKRLHHVGLYPLLESEMTGWVENETPESPNRLDAYVHAATHLMVMTKQGSTASPRGRRIRSTSAAWGQNTRRQM